MCSPRPSYRRCSSGAANVRRFFCLLDFFLAEKAYYEIDYELSHRPDWLRVPLAGILRILGEQEKVA